MEAWIYNKDERVCSVYWNERHKIFARLYKKNKNIRLVEEPDEDMIIKSRDIGIGTRDPNRIPPVIKVAPIEIKVIHIKKPNIETVAEADVNAMVDAVNSPGNDSSPVVEKPKAPQAPVSKPKRTRKAKC